MPSINVEVSEAQLETLKSIKGMNGITWRHLLRKATWFLSCTEREPFMEFGKEWGIDTSQDNVEQSLIVKIEKPCHVIRFCPYGKLVEAFHIEPGPYSDISCRVFGHDCPVFRCAEPFAE